MAVKGTEFAKMHCLARSERRRKRSPSPETVGGKVKRIYDKPEAERGVRWREGKGGRGG